MQEFAALADPTRRHIVNLLAKGERSAGDIASRFDLTPPAVSQHLKVLREAGLVLVRPAKQQRFYSLNRRQLADMAEWLARVSGFWNEKLDRLERLIEKGKSDD
jgi:DNA-binding transcriptional ArsR family regulator